MNKTILFDLDGTLIDSTDAILNSFQGAFKALGLTSKNNEEIKNLIGYPLEQMFRMLYPDKVNLSKEFVLAYREIYAQIYLEQTTLLPKAKEALELGSEIADLGIVTTKGGKFTPILLDYLRVKKFFKTLITLEDVTNPKPSSEPIILALKGLNKTQENAYMIGDTILDIQAAISANITPLALTCGYGNENELKAHSMVFLNAYEAVNYIARLN
ncbi:HAD family hydrolase [Campylobacter jejuni]|uniref:phosphoglycolate phosphatase n=1 Tax=Campylobacter jejuni TaxID=197 RepID=A0A5T1AP31_CAMJU|nr:HAD family hydrolase [Campylobacter jejuni]APA81759.1 Phosphoglycolate phosphatase [Campylobacter jejuni subsp. jejuni D42a]AJK73325.1 hydrolase [Campylobacter jejuni subsp. jejuni]ANS24527.1 putative phosphatase [Campylobacter jejuni subsp. jejuni]AOW97803.1 putative phosphatase [Campylobacter jejuni subsp. jejuni str. RM3420]ASI87968.1 Phosphoglycolate phosphatase [Campylobacter jejuni]